MLSWPIVALLNNVVQLPGNESRLVHSVDSLRHRNAEEPGANARPLQTPTSATSIETTVMFGAAETYLPLLSNSLLPYEPSLPSSPTSLSAVGDRWSLHANVNATFGQPSFTSRGLDVRLATSDLQDVLRCLPIQPYWPKRRGKSAHANDACTTTASLYAIGPVIAGRAAQDRATQLNLGVMLSS